MNSETYDRIAIITATQKRLDVKTQLSFNKLRVKLFEKETEITNINRTLSETQNEAEILRTEWVKSKDAESQLAKMISELHVRIARTTVTQKGIDVETAAKLSAMETKLETLKELEKLRTELNKSKDAESRLAQVNSETSDRIARITARQKRLNVKTQISFSRLRVELSEKETKITNINRTLSETQKELVKLRTELNKSKDAESRLAQINSETYDRIARITARQKRLNVKTQISFSKLRGKLSEKETQITNIIRTLSETQKDLEKLRTELVKLKDAESRLAHMNVELNDKLARTEAALTAKQKALDDAHAKLERQEIDTPCIICLDSDKNAAMVPCGHTSTCYTCSLKFYRKDNAKCPYCRQLIERILKIYKFVKSEDAKSQLTQENQELYGIIAELNATQERHDTETQMSMNKLRDKISEKNTETLKANRKLTATETKLSTTEAALIAKQRALEDAQAKLKRRETDTPCIICSDSDKNSALRLYFTETLKELEKLRTELNKSKDAESRLAQVNSETSDRIARITARQKRLNVKTQISFSRLRVELSEKETKITNINRTLSETQKELVKLRTESNKSKDAESRLAQINSETYDRIARITARQKRLNVKTQISFSKLRGKLSEKETQITNINRTLSETQKDLEKLRTELVKLKDAESRLAHMNVELNDKLARTEAALTAKQKALDDAHAKLERQEIDTPCIICLDSDKNAAMVPCGHTSTCYTCSLKFYRKDNAKCPYCRQLIERILKIYI
ncbi:paramyosin-like [Strongylocentrotus purpuratus]|uniref:RING-type domain-containing protein n=1 Tax=Strongylocentrotus purpuratus TaxID=7668 RepID=A0A7M7P0H5_STRPU|nr:paramyosin-like [Strongylocentrotus purpuratus]